MTRTRSRSRRSRRSRRGVAGAGGGAADLDARREARVEQQGRLEEAPEARHGLPGDDAASEGRGEEGVVAEVGPDVEHERGRRRRRRRRRKRERRRRQRRRRRRGKRAGPLEPRPPDLREPSLDRAEARQLRRDVDVELRVRVDGDEGRVRGGPGREDAERRARRRSRRRWRRGGVAAGFVVSLGAAADAVAAAAAAAATVVFAAAAATVVFAAAAAAAAAVSPSAPPSELSYRPRERSSELLGKPRLPGLAAAVAAVRPEVALDLPCRRRVERGAGGTKGRSLSRKEKPAVVAAAVSG